VPNNLTDSLTIHEVHDILSKPFWVHPNFWIEIIIAVLGLVIGWLAYKEAGRAFAEAGKAKDAATAAKEAAEASAKTVKLQTITIELSEIIQKFEKLSTSIDYASARDLFNETSRKVRRLISPFKTDNEYKDTIDLIYKQLDKTAETLSQVRPNGEEIVAFAVYNAIESHFTQLGGLLADLLGLIEKRTINLV
jgi:septation ring formation regulator EzrA